MSSFIKKIIGLKMKYILLKASAVLIFTAFFNILNAQSIQGFVSSITNEPISGVSVFLNSKKLSITNDGGIFFVSDSLNFPLKLRLQHPDYFIGNVEMSQTNSTFKLEPLEKSERLEEITIATDLKTSTPKAIFPTEKITAIKFDSYSPIELTSAINETPGVFIQSGALNTNRIVIRGVGSRTLYGTNKVRAYFNGIPITNGAGETAIDIFDPEDLESIEIIKGPKATLNGTSLGGTILLNSKDAAIGTTSFKSSLNLGSNSMLKNTVSAATANEKFSLNLNYDHLETDGFRENNKYNRKNMLLTSKYKFNLKNEISLLLNYTDYFAQIPSSLGKTAFEEDPTQAAFTWNAAQGYEENKQILTGLGFTHIFSENFSNSSNVFYTYLDHYEPRPFNILDEFTNGYGARTVFNNYFLLLEKKVNLNYGAEYYKDIYAWKTLANLYEQNNGNGSLEGDLLSDNQELRKNLNVFTSATISISEKLTAQVGLNFNQTNYTFQDHFNPAETNKSADRNFDPIFAPNLNLHYDFNKNLSAYFNFSRGFNYPSIEETLTPEGVINPDLGPEKGYNYEIGSKVSFLSQKLRFAINAYLLDIEDLLVSKRIGEDQYIGRNAGKTEHKGVELSILFSQPIGRNSVISPYLNAEITDHKFIDFVDGDASFSGNQLTGVPREKVNGGIDFLLQNFKLNANFLHIGKMPLNDANLLYSEQYTVFNAKISYKAAFSKKFSMEVQTGINNLSNEKYAASILINAKGFGNSEPRYYYPGRPRNWYSGIKLLYKI